jgi:hypothetical protein
VTSLFGDEKQIKNYLIMNIYLLGDYLKVHFEYKDRSEADYASCYYLNYLIKMKAEIYDVKFTPVENDDNYVY